MRVKCRYCGEMVEKKEAYKDQLREHFYYCNESHYLAYIKKAENKKIKEEEKKQKKIDPVYEAFVDIFGFRTQNSALFREMKLWRGICSDEKILAYLQEHKDYLKNRLERLDNKEYPRIMYASAILKNGLADYAATVKAEPEKIRVDCEIYEPVVNTKKKRRRGLSELEDEVV